MRKEAVLIGLVLVVAVLSVSGVVALSFNQVGSTNPPSIYGDGQKAVDVEVISDWNAPVQILFVENGTFCFLKKNGNVDCQGKNNPSGYSGGDGDEILLGEAKNPGPAFLKDNGSVAQISLPLNAHPNNYSDFSVGRSYIPPQYNTVDGIIYAPASFAHAECLINRTKDIVRCFGEEDVYGGKGPYTSTLHGYTPDTSSNVFGVDLEQLALGNKIACVLESDKYMDTTGPKYDRNVYCFGDHSAKFGTSACSSNQPSYNLPDCVENYTGGDAKQISAGGGGNADSSFMCVLKDNGNINCSGDYPQYSDNIQGNYDFIDAGINELCAVTNSGNIDCWGDYSAFGASTSGFYGGQDAVEVDVAVNQTCFLKDSGDIDCLRKDGSGSTYSYNWNRFPKYSGFLVQKTSDYTDKVTVEASISWSDNENNFSASTLEHNFSGNPQNVSTVQSNSHVFKTNISQTGTYYVKFYGDDSEGGYNRTAKKIFKIEGPSNNFRWENSNGNQINSLSVSNSKNVTMFANYSSEDNPSNTVDFKVYNSQTDSQVKSKNGVQVQSTGASNYSEAEIKITQGFAGANSEIYFNVSDGLSGSKSEDLSLSFQGGGQPKCEANGFNCTSSEQACVSQDGEKKNASYSCVSGGFCCNITKTAPPACPLNNPESKSCEDYSDLGQQACENNHCESGPTDTSGCVGDNCGCTWNSTEGVCKAYKNYSENSNVTEDGTCFYDENSEDSCGSDGVLETSWNVTWKNSTHNWDSSEVSNSKLPSVCQPGSQQVSCPATAELPVENDFFVPLTVLALVGVYGVLFLRRKK